MRFASEQDFATTIVRGLRRRNVALSREAPVLGRSVDLALCRHQEVHTIELKLHDWRRALRQAIDHQLASDFSFICMPARRVTLAMREAFEATGVGLLFYTDGDEWPFETVIEAQRSTGTWSVAYQRLRSHIHRESDAG